MGHCCCKEVGSRRVRSALLSLVIWQSHSYPQEVSRLTTNCKPLTPTASIYRPTPYSAYRSTLNILCRSFDPE